MAGLLDVYLAAKISSSCNVFLQKLSRRTCDVVDGGEGGGEVSGSTEVSFCHSFSIFQPFPSIAQSCSYKHCIFTVLVECFLTGSRAKKQRRINLGKSSKNCWEVLLRPIKDS